MKQRRFFLFFALPFCGMLLLFVFLSSLNRHYIQSRVKDLVEEQLYATADILKVHLIRALDAGLSTEKILAQYTSRESIHFMALLDDEKRILDWSSRFEGYLPLTSGSLEPNRSWIIDSPVGSIFNLAVDLPLLNGRTFYLYLGYSLSPLEDMNRRSRTNFFIFFAVLAGSGLLFFWALFRLQARYLNKTREAETAQKEKERYKEISALMSGVTHEIKNPLNSLSLLLELLEKKTPPEIHEEIKSGRDEIQKISRIIDLFSSSLKPFNLNIQPFSLPEMAQEVRESLSRWSGFSDREIKLKIHPDIRVSADRALVSQVLINLVRNGLEASGTSVVTIEAKERKKRVIVLVADDGPGIPSSETDRIFDPFYSRGKEMGMGIGLYITKKIIEAHGGQIAVHSEQGRKTIIQFDLLGAHK
ncbi:MAG: ATP-binding protein [Candidatus Aminicenantes bacterium]|nr:ATP-binding protein [Candidatus Aminicenantes bacterium]